MRPSVILPQDLTPLQQGVMQAQLAAQAADTIRLRLFIRYGLSEHDSFDMTTGKITYAAPVAEEPAGG